MSVLMFQLLKKCLSIVVGKRMVQRFYDSLVECLKEKDLQVSAIVGMGFDGAATFSGKTGVQTRIRKLSPHALLVHCNCHLLQLACVQADNSIERISMCI